MTSPAVALLLAALALLAGGARGARLLQADHALEAGNLTLDFAAYNNLLDEPLLTVSKATKAGRELYYEVPQAPVGVFAFFHGARRQPRDMQAVQASVAGSGAQRTGPPAGQPAAALPHPWLPCWGKPCLLLATPIALITQLPCIVGTCRLCPQRVRSVAAPTRLRGVPR